MTDSKKILDNLYELSKSFPQKSLESVAESNPITKLDEVNTILHIYVVREEIEKTTDEKYREDCRWLLQELEIHLIELQRKSDSKWLSYSPLEDLINKDCDRTISNFTF